MRLFILVRHAHSTLNVEARVNGDPTVQVPLTERGREEAAQLGHRLAQLPIELCVHTRFARTRETADAILGERNVPRVEEHARADAFPRGESLDDAARRYARAFRDLLERPESSILVVCHEIPIRYALNAAAGSDDLDGPEHQIPNTAPYPFDEAALERAADGIERITPTGGRVRAAGDE
jgi:broad specificity phosphatase PhoE